MGKLVLGKLRLINEVFQSNSYFALANNECLDLRKLEDDCRSKGLQLKTGKGFLAIKKLNGVTFNVHENGVVGMCYAVNRSAADDFNMATLPFFWRNFVINCIKKMEMK